MGAAKDRLEGVTQLLTSKTTPDVYSKGWNMHFFNCTAASQGEWIIDAGA